MFMALFLVFILYSTQIPKLRHGALKPTLQCKVQLLRELQQQCRIVIRLICAATLEFSDFGCSGRQKMSALKYCRLKL